MKHLILLFCSILVTETSVIDHGEQAWQKFKNSRRRQYMPDVEESERKKVFLKRKEMVESHNKRFENGSMSYNLRLDDFADIPLSKLIQMRNGRRPNESVRGSSAPKSLFGRRKGAAAETVDWTLLKIVTPVKNQGTCGSCYTFSTAAYLESQLAKIYPNNPKLNFSSQQSLDCTVQYGNFGCNGGLEVNVFRYIKNTGLEPMNVYPPYAGKKMNCRHLASKSKIGVTEVYHFENLTESELKDLVSTRGPICVGMDASQEDFNLYRGGIYNNSKCESSFNSLNHAVLLVGYGTAHGTPYWKLKNSWGTKWGEQGYFRIVRKNNLCGIRTDVSFADIKLVH